MKSICKISFLMIGTALGLTILSSCQSKKTETNKSAEKQQSSKVQTVGVIHPTHQNFTAEVTIAGIANPYQKVTLHSLEKGYVKSVKKDIGNFVKKGEVLAILDNPELFRQKEKLTAQLQAKKSVYDRLNSIQAKTPALTTLQQVEDAKADYESAKAELDAVNDRISFLAVKAPFNGIITKRLLDNGALVQSGLSNPGASAIYEVQQINPIRLTIPLPEVDASTIKNGMGATVSFPSLPGKTFQGKVSRTADALDPESGTMQTEIDIPNANGEIKPGIYAYVTIRISSRDSVLSLPVSAKTFYQDAPFLLIVKNKRVERIPLKEGLSDKDYFEVLNPDVNSDSKIIVDGKNMVQPGDIVEPILKTE